MQHSALIFVKEVKSLVQLLVRKLALPYQHRCFPFLYVQVPILVEVSSVEYGFHLLLGGRSEILHKAVDQLLARHLAIILLIKMPEDFLCRLNVRLVLRTGKLSRNEAENDPVELLSLLKPLDSF